MNKLVNKLEKKGISRRKFLWILGGLAAVAGVSAVLWETLRPKEKVNPARQVRPNAYVQGGKSLVSVIKGSSNTDIETLVRAAVDAIGGMGKIVTSGKAVVVKPAVLTSDPNCAPDPRVVAAVAKLAKDAGGSVIVAESSGQGNTADCLSRVGMTPQAVGVEVKPLPSDEEILMEVPNGVKLRRVKTYRTIYNCDVLISVPRLKRHGSTTVTISLKNMMGVVPKSEMDRFHNEDLSQCIADLNAVVRPDLTVVDATSAMAKEGPTGGQMIRMDTIIAAGDPVAIDRVGAQRLQELEQQRNIPSFNPAQVRHINAAAALAVGTDDLSKISVIEKGIS